MEASFSTDPKSADDGELDSDETMVTWAKRANDQVPFDGGIPLGPPFNVSRNVGAFNIGQYGGATVSVDNKVMIIAASNPTSENVQNIDLFSTTYQVIAYDAESGDISTNGPILSHSINQHFFGLGGTAFDQWRWPNIDVCCPA